MTINFGFDRAQSDYDHAEPPDEEELAEQERCRDESDPDRYRGEEDDRDDEPSQYRDAYERGER